MGLLAGEVERTPSKEIGVPGRIVDDCGYVRPLVGGVALFAMRLPLLDGRPKGGVCDAVSECSHVDVLLVCVQFQARGAPFPMSARKLIPVADKLGDCTQPVLTATNIHYEIGERVPRLPLPTPRPTTTLIRIGGCSTH